MNVYGYFLCELVCFSVVCDGTGSKLRVDRPYMGMGASWENATVSWLEPSYHNLCINACWELYGAVDGNHLPSSGAQYQLIITQPTSSNNNTDLYSFTTWEQDEGNGECPSCTVRERHNEYVQEVEIDISVKPSTDVSRHNPSKTFS